jgi:hypothetical protein
MSDPDRVKQAWQTSVRAPALPSLAAIRADVDGFHRKARRENAYVYAVQSAMILGGLAGAILAPTLLLRIGAAIVAAGGAVSAWQFRRRVSPGPVPEGAAAEPLLLYQRAQLAGQRDAAANVFLCFQLPAIPGGFMVMIGLMLRDSARPHPHFSPTAWVGLMAAQAACLAVGWLGMRRNARRLQKKIDEIDALTAEK